jgi:HPt (histidine-containing phosphotransfer) domain-containing protein
MISLDFLKSFTSNDPLKVNKYISMFLQMAPSQIEKMNAAMQANDWESLRSASHAIKPQYTYMGIKRGEELLKEIELRSGEKSSLEAIPSLIEEFNTVSQLAIIELNDYLTQNKIG